MKVTLKEILADAVKNNYAIGGFDTMGYVFTDAIIRAGEATNTPIIMMIPDFLLISEQADELFSYINFRIGRTPIPVALHLDHGGSYDMAAKAIKYGFSSVMFDGSCLPLEENIAQTREISRMAHAAGVSIEAELGHVGGGGGSLEAAEVATHLYTDPDEAVRFVLETQVDALAVAIGTVHGKYKGTPKLDLERLDAIRSKVDIPLVMHGGSGLTPDAFRSAIAHGINKVNFFTGMSLAATDGALKAVADNGGSMHFFEMIAAGQKCAEDVIKEHIGIFGTKPLK